jgi:hypothetical protein
VPGPPPSGSDDPPAPPLPAVGPCRPLEHAEAMTAPAPSSANHKAKRLPDDGFMATPGIPGVGAELFSEPTAALPAACSKVSRRDGSLACKRCGARRRRGSSCAVSQAVWSRAPLLACPTRWRGRCTQIHVRHAANRFVLRGG